MYYENVPTTKKTAKARWDSAMAKLDNYIVARNEENAEKEQEKLEKNKFKKNNRRRRYNERIN